MASTPQRDSFSSSGSTRGRDGEPRAPERARAGGAAAADAAAANNNNNDDDHDALEAVAEAALKSAQGLGATLDIVDENSPKAFNVPTMVAPGYQTKKERKESVESIVTGAKQHVAVLAVFKAMRADYDAKFADYDAKFAEQKREIETLKARNRNMDVHMTSRQVWEAFSQRFCSVLRTSAWLPPASVLWNVTRIGTVMDRYVAQEMCDADAAAVRRAMAIAGLVSTPTWGRDVWEWPVYYRMAQFLQLLQRKMGSEANLLAHPKEVVGNDVVPVPGQVNHQVLLDVMSGIAATRFAAVPGVSGASVAISMRVLAGLTPFGSPSNPITRPEPLEWLLTE